MSPVRTYKKLENEVVDAVEKKIRTFGNFFIAFFKRIHHTGKQRFTVMFIPHSEKKIFNFQISIYSLSFFIILIGVVIVALFFLATQITSMAKIYNEIDLEKDSNVSSLDYFRQEVSEFNRSSKEFIATLTDIIELISPQSVIALENGGSGGGMPVSLTEKEVDERGLYELYDLAKFKLQLENATQPLLTIRNLFETQKELFVNIPTLWPLNVKGGYLTAGYGPRIHPIDKVWHIHRGIDIIYPGSGIKVVATATGKVVRSKYDANGYGNYLVISHKYGFYTLYAHLYDTFVKVGDTVEKGQPIGYLGRTGRTTGPHLHYEVILGAQNIDPLIFIKIESPLFKKVRSYNR